MHAKENFAGHFTTQDVVGVCRYGEYISDVVVYDFAKFFTRYRKDLFVESPAVVHHLVDVETMEVNTENVAHFMVKTREPNVLSWWQRLEQGTPHLHTMYTPPTPRVHPSLPGQQLLLPVSVLHNEHWLLVVLYKTPSCVCIKVVDSLHWHCINEGIHTVHWFSRRS